MQCVVNICLKKRWNIDQSKRQDKIFGEVIASFERSFLLFTMVDSQVIEGGNDFNFIEDFSLTDSFQCFLDE